MRHCGLRRLRGRGFLSGTVLSHDFVEAAQMRRAGYEVWMDPTLCGSYEESPPTLLDELARDQRWAHGNLQHLHFLVQPDTRLAHRFAFANGIMAYVASPIWFLFLVLSTIEVARLTLWPIDYFPDRHSLFPVWPEWHPQWAIRLALSTAFLLLAPKVLAFVDVLMDRQRLRAMGGAPRVLAGVLLELVISVLLAPIRMLTHTRCVVETLLNLKVRWAGQNRTQEIGWRDAIIHHAPGGLLAAAWAGFAWWLKPLFFYWSLPVALPLVIAAPVSVWSSRFRIGAALRHAGLLVTAEQSHSPAVVEDLRGELLPPLGKLSAFEAGILDPWRNRLHACLARARRDTPGRRARRSELVGRCITSGVEALSLTERAWLAQNRLALCELHRRAWAEGPGSRCDERIEALCRGGDAAT
jgi:membrane glycosyltransferase